MNISEMLSKRQEQKIIEELEALGIDRKFLRQKSAHNLYSAKRIVKEYDFGRKLTTIEEKGLIQAILGNSLLNKENYCYLYVLMKNAKQMGLEKQDIFGMIINLGVNGKILEDPGFGYTYLLANRMNSQEKIGQYKDEIAKNVTEIMILKAASNGISEQEVKALIAEMKTLGISEGFIQSKDISNIYIAKTVVERYEFERELTREEKRSLIQSILNEISLQKGNNTHYLSVLMQRFEQIGLDEQEIYGTIINLGVHRRIIDKPGYGYTDLLHSNFKLTVNDDINKRVSEATIFIAEHTVFDEQQKQRLTKELEELGINAEFLKQKDVQNICIAKGIVENYKFPRELEPSEKRDLIQLILNNNLLNAKKGVYLSKLIQRFEKEGMDLQKIYGEIINLGVKRSALTVPGLSYSDVLMNKLGICEDMSEYMDKLQTEVTEDTIKHAKRRVERIMQRSLKKQKARGALQEQAETRAELESLVRQERDIEQNTNSIQEY